MFVEPTVLLSIKRSYLRVEEYSTFLAGHVWTGDGCPSTFHYGQLDILLQTLSGGGETERDGIFNEENHVVSKHQQNRVFTAHLTSQLLHRTAKHDGKQSPKTKYEGNGEGHERLEQQSHLNATQTSFLSAPTRQKSHVASVIKCGRARGTLSIAQMQTVLRNRGK